jgi:hypothetical protein
LSPSTNCMPIVAFAITPPPIDNVILDTGPSPGQA